MPTPIRQLDDPLPVPALPEAPPPEVPAVPEPVLLEAPHPATPRNATAVMSVNRRIETNYTR